MRSGAQRIAVVADIHGNVPAMEAVIADLGEQSIDEILAGGDLVGRGPEGSKVVRRIRELGWRGVRGNHEDYLLGFRRQQVPEAWLHDDEWSASRWMAAELDEADIDYIDGLPLSIHADRAPRLCLVHGSPRSNCDGLGPWSTDDQLEEHLRAIDGDLLVCGHTHRPLFRRLSGGLVVNVGAVGLPFNRDHRAQYAVLHVNADGCDVEFRQIDYDVGRTIEIYRTSGFLEQGGVTARLLELELEHAAPFLVPFTKWAEVESRPIAESQLGPFLDFYDPAEPIRLFMERLNLRWGERTPPTPGRTTHGD
jgi:predicted phosphodiesterase